MYMCVRARVSFTEIITNALLEKLQKLSKVKDCSMKVTILGLTLSQKLSKRPTLWHQDLKLLGFSIQPRQS